MRCTVPDCDRPARARGWCISHYDRWRRNGTVEPARPIRGYYAASIPDRLTPTPPDPDRSDWRGAAACRGMPTDWWYPSSPPPRQVLDLCNTCPVRVECLTDALATDRDHGVRAGLTPGERKAIHHRKENYV